MKAGGSEAAPGKVAAAGTPRAIPPLPGTVGSSFSSALRSLECFLNDKRRGNSRRGQNAAPPRKWKAARNVSPQYFRVI